MNSAVIKRVVMRARLEHDQDRESLEFDVTDENVRDWCLSLVLLEKKLVDVVEVRSEGLPPVRVSLYDEFPYRFTVQESASGIHVRASAAELGFWLEFALGFYRDGTGYMPVIHSDVIGGGTAQKCKVVCFHVPRARQCAERQDPLDQQSMRY